MSGRARRMAVWALAVLSCTLAPSAADGNIGCLFSPSLCAKGVEWCYDDFAFGKCIPIYEDEPENNSLFQYNMSSDELKSFEAVLQNLVSLGYRWEHAYTQCVLQAMLYSSRLQLKTVNMKSCEPFADPNIKFDAEGLFEDDEVDPEEVAYVRFTPNSPVSDSDFANEVYAPPNNHVGPSLDYQIPKVEASYFNADDNLRFLEDEDEPRSEFSSKMHDIIRLRGQESVGESPIAGFREKIYSGDFEETAPEDRLGDFLSDELVDHDFIRENNNIKKSSFPDFDESYKNAAYEDEEKALASFRKMEGNSIHPYTTEYLTGNRFTPKEAEVLSNTLEKYRESFKAKLFPFEYEDDSNDIPEQRIYVDEDDPDNFHVDTGSGEFDPHNKFLLKDDDLSEEEKSKNMELLMKYLKNDFILGTKPLDALYAEGGPLTMDIGTEASKALTNPVKKESHSHEDYVYDPTFTYVLFKDRVPTGWNRGLQIINKIRELIGLQERDFSHPRVDVGEVTFKVENNSKKITADDVARSIENITEKMRQELGVNIVAAGVGDKTKSPVVVRAEEQGFLSNRDNILVVLLASGVVVAVAGAALVMLLRRDVQARRKLVGLASAAEIDAEATQDYQDLCRARMTGKWSGQQVAPASGAVCGGDSVPQRIASLSKEPEGNSASTRSSTSSWSEEPALTNMDISTGHMVLAYMEDHLKNKDRLEQEWQALCAYEAEPCATLAALSEDNIQKNRYPSIVPYDHARVALNTVTNHLGSDYINASTITDHDPRNPAYIAAQGPLPHTAPDFWQMVWEQGSVVMVMLTRLTENGSQQCHRYWPEEASDLYHIYEVHLVSEHIWCDDYLVRSFYLKNQRTGETRTVTQFHFLSWPDNGVPASTKALLEFRRKVNKSYRGRSCPIVVHCSDGASRTGTYCLIDMVLNRMAKGAKEIDIAATLEHIRDQRPHMVSTKQQFEFVLMAVAEEVHAILKALPAQLQQQHEKKDKEATDKDKAN